MHTKKILGFLGFVFLFLGSISLYLAIWLDQSTSIVHILVLSGLLSLAFAVSFGTFLL
jgi:hypothetical protein